MPRTNPNARKPTGRPKTTGPGELIGVRLHPPLLKALDKFIAGQDGAPTRPEAVRLLLSDALTGLGLMGESDLQLRGGRG